MISNIGKDKEQNHNDADSDSEGSLLLDAPETSNSKEMPTSAAEMLTENKSATAVTEDKVLTEQGNLDAEASDGSLDEASTSKDTEMRSSSSVELLEACKTFVSNISDPVKFSCAGLCATTLHVLYGTKKDRYIFRPTCILLKVDTVALFSFNVSLV